MARVLAKTSHYVERVVADLPYWNKLQDQTTRLWERRGVKWTEADSDKLIKERDEVEKISYKEWSKK